MKWKRCVPTLNKQIHDTYKAKGKKLRELVARSLETTTIVEDVTPKGHTLFSLNKGLDPTSEVKSSLQSAYSNSGVKWKELLWEGGILTTKTHEISFGSDKVSNSRRLNSDKMDLPVKPDGVNSVFLGRYPGRYGDRPTKIGLPTVSSLYMSDILNSTFKVYYDLNKYAVVSGSFASNLEYFRKMSSRTRPDVGEGFIVRMEKIVPIVLKLLKIVELPAPGFDSVYSLKIKEEAFAGVRFSTFFNMKNKREAIDISLDLVKQFWVLASENNMCAPHIYGVGAREKRESDVSKDGPCNTRGVLAPELWFSLFEGIYSKPIERYFHCLKDHPLYLAQSFSHQGWLRYYNDIFGKKFVFEGDFKGYDCTLQQEHLILTFSILRLFYPKSTRIDNHFKFIMSSFISKNVVFPGGLCYKINKGLPSGSSFTSLVGSVCNLVILVDIIQTFCEFSDEEILNDLKFLICGDDFLVSSNIPKHIARDGLLEFCRNEHGVELKLPMLKNSDMCFPGGHGDYGLSVPLEKDILYHYQREIKHLSDSNTTNIKYNFSDCKSKVIALSLFMVEDPTTLRDTIKEYIVTNEDKANLRLWMERFTWYYRKQERFELKLFNIARAFCATTKAKRLAGEGILPISIQEMIEYDCDYLNRPDSVFKHYIETDTGKIFPNFVVKFLSMLGEFPVVMDQVDVEQTIGSNRAANQLNVLAIGSNMSCSFLKNIFDSSRPSVKFHDLIEVLLVPKTLFKKSFNGLCHADDVLRGVNTHSVHASWVYMYRTMLDRDFHNLSLKEKNERVERYANMYRRKQRDLFYSDHINIHLDSLVETYSKVGECTVSNLMSKGKKYDKQRMFDVFLNFKIDETIYLGRSLV